MDDPRRWTPVLKASWATHCGMVREHNEDLGCLARLRGAGAIGVAVLDGMGGHGGGDVASRIAARSLRRSWRRPLPEDRQARYEWLLESLYAADAAIRRYGSRSLGYGSMGATTAVAVATPEECLLMHAGDCRAYHFRHGVREFVTADHSIVRILLETGTITEDQAATHPMRSTVTSCLGGGSEARLSLDPKWDEGGGPAFRSLLPGDTLLLCSDGLWSEVAPDRIAALVAAHRGRPRRLVQACIAAALEAGAHDNVTAAALCVVRKRAPSPEDQSDHG